MSSNSPPPHSPSSENSHGSLPPPPRHSGRKLSPLHKSSSSSSDNSESSGGMSNGQKKAIVGGILGGAVLLILLLAACFCSFCRKKKNKMSNDQMIYYRDNSRGKSKAKYSSGAPTSGINPPAEHRVNIPKAGSTGVSSRYRWEAQPPPPPPPGLSSSGASSSYHSSGPLQPAPHPTFTLRLNKNNFSYDQLAAATGGFGKENLLGEGGFGFVYKGVLPNGKKIAVKSLKSGSCQGEREFQAEVEIISRVHHRHLVSLVGYCMADDKRMLVYEFLPNGTLQQHLHGKGGAFMDWPLRIRTAVGSAKGFAYLHEDCHPRIIHRDIKTSNILLDEQYVAKVFCFSKEDNYMRVGVPHRRTVQHIFCRLLFAERWKPHVLLLFTDNMCRKVGDFGLAKLSSDEYTHVSTRIMGTYGYLAPEYASTGKLTEKSDVYSFGVMLLELISGKHPVNVNSKGDTLVDWARPILMKAVEGGSLDQLADPRLENNYNPDEMLRMVVCAAACIRHSARSRPKMSRIVRALEGNISLKHLGDGVGTVQSSPLTNDISEGDSSYGADM